MQHYVNSNRNWNNMEDVPVTSSEEWLPAADQVSRNAIRKSMYRISRVKPKEAVFNIDVSSIDANLWKKWKINARISIWYI